MTKPGREVVFEDQLFRVEHQPVDGRAMPYVFVTRIGAVTILPIIQRPAETPQALVIQNKRLYYGTSVGLPGGNIDGGFERPERPALTAERELLEETGYGYSWPGDRNIDVFRLRNLSNTIDYPRFFAVMRGVDYVGGEDNNPHEIVTCRPMPLDEYVDPLFELDRGEMYPEVNAAFARAERRLGREAAMSWLLAERVPQAADVPQAFAPWLLPAAA